MKSNPIYFSKVYFLKYMVRSETTILLNLETKELSIQVIKNKHQAPAIEKHAFTERCGDLTEQIFSIPARKVRDSFTGWKWKILPSLEPETDVLFSEGIGLNETQMSNLLKYCNAFDFEPFIGREMDLNDPSCIGYRDEITMYFVGITNSYIPKIELPMQYLYSGKYECPTERLYQFLVSNIIRQDKRFSKCWV